MKTIKTKKALLLTLTLFAALQAVTTFGMENGNEGSWWGQNIFSTISNLYNTTSTSIENHPYITALLVAGTGATIAAYANNGTDSKSTKKEVISRPENMSDVDFLWKILDETTLEKKLTDEELIPYINKIKELYEKNATIFKNNKKNNISPRIFAAFNCRYQIGKIIDDLRDASKSTKTEANESIKKDEKSSCNWSEEMSKKLHDTIHLALQKESIGKQLKLDPFGAWTLTIDVETGYSETLQVFKCNLFKDQEKIAELTAFYYMDEKDLYVSILYVHKSYRRLGIGAHLLHAIIDELKESSKAGDAKKISSSLIAVPEQPKMFSKLLNYYKSLGYEPTEKASNAGRCKLKLTIKNGAIIHRWETPTSTKLDN